MDKASYKLRNGKEVIVRTATTADAEQVIGLIQNILSTTDYTLTTTEEFDASIEAQENWIQQYINNECWVLLLAEVDGQIVGNLDFRNNPKLRNQHCGEFGMGIHNSHRGIGIGTAILTEFMKWAEASPIIKKVNLSVMTINKHGVKLYEKAGFIEQGRQPMAVKLTDTEYAEVIEMYKFV